MWRGSRCCIRRMRRRARGRGLLWCLWTDGRGMVIGRVGLALVIRIFKVAKILEISDSDVKELRLEI